MQHHSRKYILNENFFDCWNPTMAYVLGFWFADGNMRHDRSYMIRFYSKDLEIIEKIRTSMDCTNRITRDRDICYGMQIHSKHMYYRLLEIGGCESKSIKLKFPIIPSNYWRDFIRGYFDGDGSVHFITYKATRNKKLYTELRSNFTCGTRSFLDKVNKLLNNTIGTNIKILGQYGPHQFKLGYGQGDTKKLLEWMYYQGHTISMSRKAKFLEYYSTA